MSAETKTYFTEFLQEMVQEMLQEMLQLVVLVERNLHLIL